MKLTADVCIVLSAIADQELTFAEVAIEVRDTKNKLKGPLTDILEDCLNNNFLRRTWINGVAYFESTQTLPKNCQLLNQ